MQDPEKETNIVRTSIRMALGVHKKLSAYVNSKKYTPEQTSIDATVQQAVREFLDRSENAESGNQQFRNPSPIYPPGTDQIKFPSIRNTRWDHAINVLRTAQENIAQALDTLAAVTHDEHAGDSDLPTGAELERQVDAALKTRTPSVKKAVEAAGKSGGNRAAAKGDTKGNRGRKRA